MKFILTVVVLSFVVASVAYLIVGEVRSKVVPPGAETKGEVNGANSAVVGVDEPRTQSEPLVKPVDPVVIAYYFHGTMRCPTCLKMEEYSRSAIEEAYPSELREGRIRWPAVDYDQRDNEHFVKEYELVASAIVVRRDGTNEQGAWRKLERAWDLVGDEGAFKRYVADEVATMLKGDL